MDEITILVENVANYMERDVRGAQFGCYSLALAGLTLAIRKVRPFSRFKRPSDIPNHFIKEKRELVGVVTRIDPNGGLLMIQHKPLIALPGSSNGQLPVKLTGVNVSGLGISWLQTIVAGQEVKFIPIVKNEDFVQCEVILPQEFLDAKKRKQVKMLDVGESLVKIGFGQIDIDKPLLNNLDFQPYYNKLQQAEQYALRKQLGLKYYVKPTKLILLALSKKLGDIFDQSVKKAVKLPKMVNPRFFAPSYIKPEKITRPDSWYKNVIIMENPY